MGVVGGEISSLLFISWLLGLEISNQHQSFI